MLAFLIRKLKLKPLLRFFFVSFILVIAIFRLTSTQYAFNFAFGSFFKGNISQVSDRNGQSITTRYVIIENQIGPLAIRMKTIQGMIVQYFIMSNLNVEHIEFISASNKLKDCDVKDKEKYRKERF